MEQLTQLSSWINLRKHAEAMRFAEINNLKNSFSRNKLLTLSSDKIQVNFGSQLVDETSIGLLVSLAKERNLSQKIQALLHGEIVNFSEHRPALHTALRVLDDVPI